MDRCATCNRAIVAGGRRDGNLRFCSLPCYAATEDGRFCANCVAETTMEGPGDMRTVNGIGTVLRGDDRRCPTCHSVAQQKWFQFIVLPVIPMDRYRILYLYPETTRYIG